MYFQASILIKYISSINLFVGFRLFVLPSSVRLGVLVRVRHVIHRIVPLLPIIVAASNRRVLRAYNASLISNVALFVLNLDHVTAPQVLPAILIEFRRSILCGFRELLAHVARGRELKTSQVVGVILVLVLVFRPVVAHEHYSHILLVPLGHVLVASGLHLYLLDARRDLGSLLVLETVSLEVHFILVILGLGRLVRVPYFFVLVCVGDGRLLGMQLVRKLALHHVLVSVAVCKGIIFIPSVS